MSEYIQCLLNRMNYQHFQLGHCLTLVVVPYQSIHTLRITYMFLWPLYSFSLQKYSSLLLWTLFRTFFVSRGKGSDWGWLEVIRLAGAYCS